jgi:hypothetical protein
MLAVAQAWLSGSAGVAAASTRVYATLAALALSAGLAWRYCNSVPRTAMLLAGYLARTLWIHSQWMLVPLAFGAAVLLWRTRSRHGLQRATNPRPWVGASVPTRLILSIDRYADFLVLEKLRYGQDHQDALFHASITSMIKTYGVVSTGLHGLLRGIASNRGIVRICSV